MVALRVYSRPRQSKERSAVVVENISEVTLNVSFRSTRNEIENRHLPVGGCWVIERSLRQGRWTLKSSDGVCHPGPFSIQVLSDSVISEEWEFQADGPIKQVLRHDKTIAAGPSDNLSLQRRQAQSASIFHTVADRRGQVLAAIRQSNPENDGVLDVSQLSAVLKALDGEIFTEEHVSALLAQADGINDGKVDCDAFLHWLFENQTSKGESPKDHSACASMPGGDDGLAQRQAEGEDRVNVEVCWTASGSKACSLVLHDVPSAFSLSELKLRCAASLQVAAVEPLDYSEDMDALTLAELGIGSSGLPLAVMLVGEPAGPPAEPTRSPCLVAPASAALPALRSRRAAPAAAPPASGVRPPLAERQAREDLSEVVNGFLYLSGQVGAGNRAALKGVGITHILNVCDRIPCKFKNDFTYKIVSVFDTRGSDIRKHFPEALEFINNAQAIGGRCLVHCMVGASRSTSIVLAWLVSHRGVSLKDAYKDVRSRRGVAKPNRAFCEQLIEFEFEVRGCKSATLADFGHAS